MFEMDVEEIGSEVLDWTELFQCIFPHSTVTSFLLGQNIFLSALYSNTLDLCSSSGKIDQVSYPYSP
jgi:hypothetical protein